MGKDVVVERTVATVLLELREACAISKANGLKPESRKKANWALYKEAVLLDATPEELDAAVKVSKVTYNFNDEPDVKNALADIQGRCDGPLGQAWVKLDAAKDVAHTAWRAALKIYQDADTAETLAYAKVISKTKTTLLGKGHDGADLDVPYKVLAIDGKAKTTTGSRGANNSQGPAPALTDGKYSKIGTGKPTARMMVSNDGATFLVTAPKGATGSYTSATKAAQAAALAMGYKPGQDGVCARNGKTFWKVGT